MRAITLVVAGVATLLAASPCGAEPPRRTATQEEEEVQYARWPWPVVLEGKASKETIALGEKLRQVLGVKFSLQSGVTRNPGCCMWVQITNWTPNPGKPGYVVVIQPGGGWIQASDLSQLEKAIDQIAAVVRNVNGDCELPVGVLTNYGTIQSLPEK